jgi:hypothetical protein
MDQDKFEGMFGTIFGHFGKLFGAAFVSIILSWVIGGIFTLVLIVGMIAAINKYLL